MVKIALSICEFYISFLKSLFIVLSLIFLLLCSSCNYIQSNPSPIFFTPIEHKVSGILNPHIAWTFHQPESDVTLDGLTSSPSVDLEGNLYFFDYRRNLYSLNQTGQKRWEKRGFSGGKYNIVLTQEGLIVGKGINKICLLTSEGDVSWIKEFDSSISDFFVNPSGALFVYASNLLYCLDAKGKNQWSFPLGENWRLGRYFFDSESNGYFFFRLIDNKSFISEEKRYNFDNYLISISPDGKLRWKKLLTQNRNLIESFSPDNFLCNHVFLLAYHHEPLISQDLGSLKLVAYDVNGNEVWNYNDPYKGNSVLPYAFNQKDNQFYVFLNETFSKNNSKVTDKSRIISISSEGELIFKKELMGRILDYSDVDENNIRYVCVGKDRETYLYALDYMGVEVWNIPISSGSLNLKPVLSSNKTLFLSSNNTVEVICIQDYK